MIQDNPGFVIKLSVKRKKFDMTNKSKLLHVTVKAYVSDVSASFWADILIFLALDAPVYKSLILQQQL